MTTIQRGGRTTDLTTAFYSSGLFNGWSPDGTLDCFEEELSWETLDGAGGLVLECP